MPPEPYRHQPPQRPSWPLLPATGWARWTVGLLMATIALDVIAVFSDMAEVELLSRIAVGSFTEAEALANDARQALIGAWQFGLLIAAAIALLGWIHRACRNLTALGAQELQFSPGWAVGWFFVPFMNFVRPYQVVREIWTASDPDVTVSDAAARRHASAAPVGRWWGTWIAAGLLPMFALLGIGTVAGSLSLLASDLMHAVAAALAIVVVRGIDARQREKAAVLWREADPGMAARPVEET